MVPINGDAVRVYGGPARIGSVPDKVKKEARLAIRHRV